MTPWVGGRNSHRTNWRMRQNVMLSIYGSVNVNPNEIIKKAGELHLEAWAQGRRVPLAAGLRNTQHPHLWSSGKQGEWQVPGTR